MAGIETIRVQAIGVRVIPRITETDVLMHVVSYQLPGMRYEPIEEFYEIDDALAAADHHRVGLD